MLRGAAILMVVLSHYADWYADIWHSEQIHYGLTRLGVYGVDLFFLVSGYGLVKSAGKYKSAWHYWKNRLESTYFPYLIIAGGIGLCAGNLKTAQEWYQLVSGYDFWFIRNILVFYLLFFLIFWGIRRRWIRSALFAAGVFGYSWWLMEAGRGSFWFVSNIAIVIGVLLALYEKELFAAAGFAWPLQLAVLTVLMLLMAKNGIDIRFTPLENCDKMMRGSVASGIWTLLCTQMACLLSKSFSFLKFPGRLSLELYLLHQVIYLQTSAVCGAQHRYLAGSLAILLTAAGAWIFHSLFAGFWKLTDSIGEKQKWRFKQEDQNKVE